MKKLIKNGQIVNEGKIVVGDVLIHNERISRIDETINEPHCKIIDATGLIVIPGMIDDQVHFREPGLTHKATIASESIAAIAGGITSYMDMPNTIPNTLTRELLEEKYRIAAASSLANYSFYMGISQSNMEEALQIDNELVCGITDDGLYFNQEGSILCNQPTFLDKLFSRSEAMIALHCEDEPLIKRNTQLAKAHYGDAIPFNQHPFIRSVEACFNATKTVIELAQKHQNRVHIFHVSTAAETELFNHLTPIRNKRITAEACVHHLHFNDQQYDSLGSLIKWNPAIKSEQDRLGLINALKANKLDIIATDHAPHTLMEKNQSYTKALSGGPLVQHNPHLDLDYVVRFSSPEFTSICPITGQPDFANIVIDYVPSKEIVESKSLKLYLVSYRNHGAFHEDCTIQIAKDIIATIKPKWLRIGGYWYPRGGIPIDIFYQTSLPPKNVWIKDQNIPNYKGRG